MISIIVPIYNSGKYLSQCIESILNQTYSDIELLLIDNGSLDNSFSICQKYKMLDSRVQVYEEKKRGPFYARKLGIKKSRGKYVTFVDSDDFISNISYEYAKNDMENDMDLICFGIKRFFSGDNIRDEYATSKRKEFDKDTIVSDVFPKMIWNKDKNSYGIDPSLCNKVFKTDKLKLIFSEIDQMDFHYGEDVAVFYLFMISVEKMVILPQTYYYHRQREKKDIPIYIRDSLYFEKLFILYKMLLKYMGGDANFREQIDLFYINSVNLKKRQYNLPQNSCDELFPFDKIEKEKNIVIYGAGKIGTIYINQIKKINYCKNILWVDLKFENLGEDVYSPTKISDFSYDYIIIAIENAYTRKQVFYYLVEQMGVSQEKIIRRENDDF